MRAIAALMLTACSVSWTKAPEEARSQFVIDYTCPANRVVAVEDPLVPPDEVRADPERLQLWNEQHEEFHYRLARVQGCGHTVVYKCYRSGRYSEFMRCAAEPDAPLNAPASDGGAPK